MNATALYFSIVCALSVALISLISSQLYKKEPLLNSELMSFISFAPGLIYSGFTIFNISSSVSAYILFSLLIKNFFYCLSFYYRYESLRKFGPFIGALMLGTQPIIIFLFGLLLLGETLSSFQILSVGLTTSALILLTTRNNSGEISINFAGFTKYYLFPTLASALAIIWDRYFLNGKFPSSEFFIIDRFTLVPAFLLSLAFIKGKNFRKSLWQNHYKYILENNWKALSSSAFLFTLSVYAYNMALELEKAALVGLFRNAAYPLAAFVGTFWFKQRLTKIQWVSLSLILLSMYLGFV